MENILDDEILTERECAALLRLHVKTLQRARKRGEPIVPFSMAGRQIRYSKQSVLKTIQQGREFESVDTQSRKPQSREPMTLPRALSGTRRPGRPRKRHEEE